MSLSRASNTSLSPIPALDYPSPVAAGWVLGLLTFAAVIAFVDQQLLALLLTPIERDLALSDKNVGLLQGVGFNLFLGLTIIPISHVIDRSRRVRFFFIATVAWSAFTVACGFCTSFYQLFFCRLGVGIAEAGLYPAAFSLIADLYPLQRRSAALFMFYVGVLVSTGIATALSGFAIGIVENHLHAISWGGLFGSPWRLTFLAVGAPGFVLALLFLGAQEPARQGDQITETGGDTRVSFRSYLRENWVTVCRLVGGLALSYGGYNTFLFWMPTILSRIYGYSTASSGEVYGLTFGAGAVCGTLISGMLQRWHVFSGPLGPLRILKIGALGAAVVLPLFLFARSASQLLIIYFGLCTTTYIASLVGSGLMTAVCPNRLRARIFALNQMLAVFIISASPPLVGTLSDHLFSGRTGLLYACCAVTIPLVFAAPWLFAKLDGPYLRSIENSADGDQPSLPPASFAEDMLDELGVVIEQRR